MWDLMIETDGKNTVVTVALPAQGGDFLHEEIWGLGPLQHPQRRTPCREDSSHMRSRRKSCNKEVGLFHLA